MKKPALLRAAIARLLPEVAADYDKLAMWVERAACAGAWAATTASPGPMN
ncbi:MAG: hypothetical protein IH998_08525 [Proteobacteria bacterium]|nr:hypothetical protein [Pseudomonadota bacterium]